MPKNIQRGSSEGLALPIFGGGAQRSHPKAAANTVAATMARKQPQGPGVHGSVHFFLLKMVPIKVAIAISIAIGFVFLFVYLSDWGGMPPEK